MTEKKVAVPEGVWTAVNESTKNMTTGQFVIARDAVEAAFRWLTNEHPSMAVLQAIQRELVPYVESIQPFTLEKIAAILAIAHRRMFLAPEPEQEFSEAFDTLTVEINRVGGIKKATEILALALTGEPINMEPFRPKPSDGYIHYNMRDAEDFMECDTCRAKPGSPTLCAGCLHNREIINQFTSKAAK